jgi:hypothetical protein
VRVVVDGAFDRPEERPARPTEADPAIRRDPWEEFEDGVIGRVIEDARRRSGDEPSEPRRPPPWEEPGVIERLIGEDRPRDGWVDQPVREFQRPINAHYEAWVREETGGPPHMEYAVDDGKGGFVHFDSRVVEERDGERIEVLIDAKGSYAQFLDADGDWSEFFTRFEDKGLNRMRYDAGRQVAAAGGRPVEWWCMQEEVAEALNDAFERDDKLRGRIEAVYRPMPVVESEG